MSTTLQILKQLAYLCVHPWKKRQSNVTNYQLQNLFSFVEQQLVIYGMRKKLPLFMNIYVYLFIMIKIPRTY